MKAIYALFATLIIGFCLAGGIDPDAYQSASMDAAIAEQGEAFRLARAAKEMCGSDPYTLIDSSTVQCLPHAGSKAVVATAP